jgi:choline dehydrogenase-like flavoprotein
MTAYIQQQSSTSGLEAEAFDIIIIGGGTSGLVLAARLSEDPTVQVLVIEAGSNQLNDPCIKTPGLAISMYGDPKYDWCFMSEPQVNKNWFYPSSSIFANTSVRRT